MKVPIGIIYAVITGAILAFIYHIFTKTRDQKNNFLRQFLYLNFYKTDTVIKQSDKGRETIKKLFFAYHKNPDLLPQEILNSEKNEPIEDIIKDYIAGMTDDFALNTAKKLNTN